MLGLEGLGLGWGWGLGSWNRLDRDQLGVDKIGWELGFNECEDDERVGKSGVGVIWKIE